METILGEREMISRIEMRRPCRSVGSTVLQKYTAEATLPQGKASLLRSIDQLIAMEA